MSNQRQSNDKIILLSPTQLFFPYRLLIIKSLFKEKKISFVDLKSKLGITSGNLVSHLRVLQKDDLITFKKEFKDNKPHTTYSITEKGIYEFTKLRERLFEVLK